MYLVGSFIVAMALLGTQAMSILKPAADQTGIKSAEYVKEENKVLKVFSFFLLFLVLVLLLTKFESNR